MQNLLTCPLSLLAQVEYSYSIQLTRSGTWSSLLDLLVRVRNFDDCGALESVHKSWTARLGGNYSNSKHLFRLQGRRPARLVGDPDVDSFCEFHHLDHPLHRRGKELRKRRRFWNWFAFAADNFLSNSRLRQRSVSRTVGGARVGGFSATAARLGLETFTILRSTPGISVCPGTGGSLLLWAWQ